MFPVLGSPLDPRARGTNGLIREGATLIESAADITPALTAMRERRIEEDHMHIPVSAPPHQPSEAELEPVRARLVELLGPPSVDVDELIRQTKLTLPVVITILLELDLAGRLDRHPSNKVSIR